MLYAFRSKLPVKPNTRSVSTRPAAPVHREHREKGGLRVNEKLPNWLLLNPRNTIVPLYGEIPQRPSVLVMHTYPDPHGFEQRLEGYQRTKLAFQEAGASVFFICAQQPRINLLTAIEQHMRYSFPVYLPYGTTIADLEARGLYNKPSTTILLPDRTIVGHSASQETDLKDEAERTLEYMFMQKLFVHDAPKMKF